MFLKTFVIFILISVGYGHGWDSDDLELFDLVEEVNDNFYEVMGLEKVCLIICK